MTPARAVHPHVCGEHYVAAHATTDGRRFIPTCVGNIRECPRKLLGVVGSSPRVWGTYNSAASPGGGVRFIPTCVGNMVGRLACRPAETVHPHVCGEHVNRETGAAVATGSSPRVWGTLTKRCCPAGGITVHPHVCGEHQNPDGGDDCGDGSSPRVWGTCIRRSRFRL